MRTSHFSWLLFLLLSSTAPAMAQDRLVSGQVQHGTTHQPLAFVSLGLSGKNVGTVTDEQGRFSLVIPAPFAHDTLTFSALGYQPTYVPVGQVASATPLTVVLTAQAAPLPEVVVRGRPTKLRRLGTTTHNPLLWGNVQRKGTSDIVEFASFIAVGSTPADIQQAHIFLRHPTGDTLTFRLNFYRAGADQPAERLVDQQLLVRTVVRNGWLTIDLTKYALTLRQDCYLSFEFLPVNHTAVPPFSYGAQLGGGAFVRTSSLGTWKRVADASLAAYVTVRQ